MQALALAETIAIVLRMLFGCGKALGRARCADFGQTFMLLSFKTPSAQGVNEEQVLPCDGGSHDHVKGIRCSPSLPTVKLSKLSPCPIQPGFSMRGDLRLHSCSECVCGLVRTDCNV